MKGAKPETSGNNDRIPVFLAPGRAFGSGLHETTISCLEALEGLGSLAGRSVLDVGAGNGILSLAALALGARNAVALDIESEAARTCLESASINPTAHRMNVFQGTVEALRSSLKFDLILANIYGDIVLDRALDLRTHLAEEGFMILSGIDYGDSRTVRKTMSSLGLEKRSVQFLEEFVTQVWFNPPPRASGGP